MGCLFLTSMDCIAAERARESRESAKETPGVRAGTQNGLFIMKKMSFYCKVMTIKADLDPLLLPEERKKIVVFVVYWLAEKRKRFLSKPLYVCLINHNFIYKFLSKHLLK